jgi:hypothetical protein
MDIYNIGVRGGLKKTNKPVFDDESVVLIDDNFTIFLWFGNKISEKRKNLSMLKLKEMNEKKDIKASIQINHQYHEYGAFLDIFNILKLSDGKNIEKRRRPELEIEYDATLEYLEAGLDPDLEAEITIISHSISKENKSYEELCQELAKLQISLIKRNIKPSKKEIQIKTKEIFNSSSTYEELCWLIAQLTVLKKKNEIK